MELVIANVALANAFIGQQLFTALVLMAVITTVATPPLLKRAYERLPDAERAPLKALSADGIDRDPVV